MQFLKKYFSDRRMIELMSGIFTLKVYSKCIFQIIDTLENSGRNICVQFHFSLCSPFPSFTEFTLPLSLALALAFIRCHCLWASATLFAYYRWMHRQQAIEILPSYLVKGRNAFLVFRHWQKFQYVDHGTLRIQISNTIHRFAIHRVVQSKCIKWK